MKFKKVLAGVCVGAMVASMAVVPAFAAEDMPLVENAEISSWDSLWIQLYGLADVDLTDAVLEYSITVPGAASMWDGFTVLNTLNYTVSFEGTVDTTDYIFTSDVPEVNGDGGFGFNIQAGHTDVIVNYVKLTWPEEEATEPSEEATEPSEEVTEPSEEATEPSEEATEPSEEATNPSEEESSEEETSAAPTTTPSEEGEGENSGDVAPVAGLAFVAVAAFGAAIVAKKREIA